MLRAGLAHHDLARLFDNLGFDFARSSFINDSREWWRRSPAVRTSLTQRGQSESVSLENQVAARDRS